MPIQRFGAILLSQGEFDGYLDKLLHAHRDENLDGVMCRSLLSVDYAATSTTATSTRCSICRWRAADANACISPTCSTTTSRQSDRVAGHCFGCTAGQGSSCGGALKEAAE